MSRRFGASGAPIGLHIDGRRAYAVQLDRVEPGWRIKASACLPRTGHDGEIGYEEVCRIAHTLTRQGFTGNAVVLAAPDEMLSASILELPGAGSGASTEQVVGAELARINKCDSESFEMSYRSLPDPDGAARSVLATACPRDDADALLDIFERAGLNVIALDARAAALARACRAALADASGITAVLDVGWDSAFLVILFQGELFYTRSLGDFGIRRLWKSLTEQIGIDSDAADCLFTEVRLDTGANPDDDGGPFEDFGSAVSMHFKALAEKLKAPFSYAARQCGQEKIGRVLLTGDGVSVPGLGSLLADKFDTQVSVVQMEDLELRGSESFDGTGRLAALATAAGLAMFDETGAAGSYNFISAQRRRSRRRRVQKRRWAVALGVYAFLLLVTYSTCYAIRTQDRGAVADKIALTRSRIKQTNRDLSAARTALAETRLKIAGNRAVGRPPDWGMLLAILSVGVGDDIVLNNLRLAPDDSASGGFALEITGFGRSRKAVSGFVLRMEETTLFERVALTQTRQESAPAGKVIAFRLACSLLHGNGSDQ